jgi:hypothetical protein
MLLPDDLIAKLAECAKANFVGARDIWFDRLSLSTWTVAFGLLLELPELVYELKSIARERIHWFRHRIILLEDRVQLAKFAAFIGWFLIVAGVVGEGFAGIKINNLDAGIQGCNAAKLTEATLNAGEAKNSATEAEGAAKGAKEESDKATISASNALALAKGAREEADSFENDIVSAKQLAADAESHLAEALKEAADAQAELNRLKSHRSLTNVSALVSALESFKGTDFGFVGIFGDEESRNLAGEISDALRQAGWKPSFAPTTGRGDLSIRVNNFPFGVALTINTGVHMQAESEEKVETLKGLPLSKVPRQLQAAFALKNALASSISPSQDDLLSSQVGVVNPSDRQNPRNFTAVLIEVGKKP